MIIPNDIMMIQVLLEFFFYSSLALTAKRYAYVLCTSFVFKLIFFISIEKKKDKTLTLTII